jgi:16S rRNA C967 or C1407 C5-methylase (RsmB/RsmF family)
MWKDPIVEEVRRVREKLWKEANYDVHIMIENEEKAVERIEKEYGIKFKKVIRVKSKGDKSMHTKLEKLKEDIEDFRKTLENTDPSLWTPERFSEVNAMFTMIEEDVMETEREHTELLSELKYFLELLAQFRKKYFETRTEI